MDESERKKALELLKELRNVRQSGEIQGNEKRLTWMYKGPNDLVDKEEYLLGKAIDKSFDLGNDGDSSDIIGRNYEPSNVPKRLLSKPESTEQVDIEKKILEDPLYAIKQKEMEARRKLLNNPVKLKELQKMIMERNMQKLERKKQKKKQKKKDAMKDEKYLDKLILKKLYILSENQRKKVLLEAAEVSDSSDSDVKRMKNKKKVPKNEQTPESRSENNSCESSDNMKIKKKKTEVNDIFRTQRHMSAEKIRGRYRRTRRDDVTDKKKENLTFRKEKREWYQTKGRKNSSKKSRSMSSESQSSSGSGSDSGSSYGSDSSSSSSGSDSSSDGDNSHETRKDRIRKVKPGRDNFKNRSFAHVRSIDKYKKEVKYATYKGKETDEKSRNLKRHCRKFDSSSSDLEGGINQKRSHREHNREVIIQMKSRPRGRQYYEETGSRHDRISRKNPLTSYSQVKQVSEKDIDAKLKEMVENAKLRKIEREQNLANHRKVQSEEEKLKDYDDGFMRRQISHATSQGTVADRIRSNVNNIQRSKADMDRSFVKK